MTRSLPSSTDVITLGFGRASADLAAVVATLTATMIAVQMNGPPVVRAPLAVLVVFLLPGYTLSIALFPAGESTLGDRSTRDTEDGISLLDRAVLSVGLSLGLVVLVGLVVDALPVRIAAESLLWGVVTLTGATVPVAHFRRRRVPVADRYTPIPTASPGSSVARSGGLDVLSVALALSVVFAGSAMAYSVGGATDQDDVTELYFLTESADGELVTGEYPTTLTAGAATNLTLAVENREGEGIEYHVVGQLQRVTGQRNDSVVQSRQRVFAERMTVDAGERATLGTTIQPDRAGRYRLAVLLYVGDVPDRPRMDNAYREIHLWIRVG